MAYRNRERKWAIDFMTERNYDTVDSSARSVVSTRHRVVPSSNLLYPVGFVQEGIMQERAQDGADQNLIVKRSWDIALGPIKQVPMNMFIMWMAGNSISIFPIMMVGMMFFRPIQALFGIQNTFKMIEGDQAILQKLVYLVGNVLCLAMAVYKCSVMGLLPSHASDWLAFVQPQERMEWSGGGVLL
ncbi:ER membrane protein complex subunit 4-like [Gigantopelta aegis]|uniref:ER membrane protein complex subunit 4-like n=1 Tax=Gigantopelta aegis TaxID=1735272 RepID=UPI001B887649|nr:ER membrane protein complex subunit 4-like [Gigantopelta aegis]